MAKAARKAAKIKPVLAWGFVNNLTGRIDSSDTSLYKPSPDDACDDETIIRVEIRPAPKRRRK